MGETFRRVAAITPVGSHAAGRRRRAVGDINMAHNARRDAAGAMSSDDYPRLYNLSCAVRRVLVDGQPVGLEVDAVVGRDRVVRGEGALEGLLLLRRVLAEGLLELLVQGR